MLGKEKLGLQRKIVSVTTSDGWRHAPHAGFLYEPDVTMLLDLLKEINAGKTLGEAITFNTAMLKVILEGMKVCPKMNGQIRFSARLMRGKMEYPDSIDVNLPIIVGGETTTVKLRSADSMNMRGIRDAVADLTRRAANTCMPQVMYEVGLRDTLLELRKFHILSALGRLIGFWLDGGPKNLLRGEEKKKYESTPSTERLTKEDMNRGTVTISNTGTLFRHWSGKCLLLDLIPPQTVALAINQIEEKAVPKKDGTFGIARTVGLTIVFDHRALDGGDFLPFIRRVEKVLASPEILRSLV